MTETDTIAIPPDQEAIFVITMGPEIVISSLLSTIAKALITTLMITTIITITILAQDLGSKTHMIKIMTTIFMRLK